MAPRGPKPKLRMVTNNGASVPSKARKPSTSVPAWVPPLGRDIYRRVVDELKQQGRLTRENRDAVDIYVSSLVTIRRCHRSIEKAGPFFAMPDGMQKAHPGFAIIAEAEKAARMMAGRLGIIENSREAGKSAGVQARHVSNDPFAEDDE